MAFATVEEAIQDIRDGKMLVVVDDEDRENEGDIIVAADTVTPEQMNFMATYAKGLICTPMEGRLLDFLTILFVFGVILLAGLVQTVTGFAYALIAVPLLAMLLSDAEPEHMLVHMPLRVRESVRRLD